jgi:hypothetical protein
VPHLTSQHTSAKLDLQRFVGQRAWSFRFDIVDSVTGYRRAIKPIMGGQGGIRHDTQGTIKRTITGLGLNRADTAVFSSITSRLEVFMLIAGQEFKLGRYVVSDWARQRITSGDTSAAAFFDEGFIVDQQISSAFGANSSSGEVASSMMVRFLRRFPIEYHIEEPTNFTSLGSWGLGTRGGFILEQLALDGDYFSPWFDHQSVLRFRRVFDPARELPTFDFDEPGRVLRENIIESDNLIDAPNRFVVVGNGADALGNEIAAFADVPSSAPHSIENRGFVISSIENRQVRNNAQAGAIARNLALNQKIVEQVEVSTLADPRHESYDIVLWRGVKWLEVAWTLPFTVGSPMTHVLRRAYA